MMDMERVNDYMARVSASEHTTFPPADGEMKVGLDLGTAYIVLVVLDGADNPVACEKQVPRCCGTAWWSITSARCRSCAS